MINSPILGARTPPATPPRLLSATARNGTPLNQDSDSSSLHGTFNMQNLPDYINMDYEKIIIEDLRRHHVYISFENGLQNVLNVPSDWKYANHEFQKIISEVRRDEEYQKLRATYLDVCNTCTQEEDLYEARVELYNQVTSLIKKFRDKGYHKNGEPSSYSQVSDPNRVDQGTFQPYIAPDIIGVYKQPEDVESWMWPAVIGEMKNVDMALLDTGAGVPQAIMEGEEDPVSTYRYPMRKHAKNTEDTNTNEQETPTGSKRKNTSNALGPNKVPRNDYQSTSSTRQWSSLESTKMTNDTQVMNKIRIHCAQYLMDILESSFLRSHAFLTLVDRDYLQIMYADRSAIITTSIIDLTTEEGEAMFLAMFIAFHRLTPEQWGFISLVKNASSIEKYDRTASPQHNNVDIRIDIKKRDCLKGLDLMLGQDSNETGCRLTLGDIIYHQPEIIGRGTCVIEAKAQDIKGWDETPNLVVKISWPSKIHHSEIALLDRARKRGEEMMKTRQALWNQLKLEVDSLHASGKIKETREKQLELDKMTKMVEESGKHWALSHLPNILYSQDFILDSDSKPMPQKALEHFFKNATIIDGTFEYEPRNLRVCVQEKLYKMVELSSLRDCAQVFFDVLQCHYWLHEHAEILHRDMSSGNIMYRKHGQKIYGVLNDLDLSSLREDVENRNRASLQRTGTPPYMAIDLLLDAHGGTAPHLYRHDLESLAYVILIFCSRHKFQAGAIRRLSKSSFDDWFNAKLSWPNLGQNKLNYLLKFNTVEPHIDKSFGDFVLLLNSILNKFKVGFSSRINWSVESIKYDIYKKMAQFAQESEEVDPLYEQYPRALTRAIVQPPTPFDEQTFGGHIDYYKLVTIFKSFNFGGKKLLIRNRDPIDAP